MFDLPALHKTGFITVQKSPNLHVGHFRRTFRTRGQQTSMLEAVARPKNRKVKVYIINVATLASLNQN